MLKIENILGRFACDTFLLHDLVEQNGYVILSSVICVNELSHLMDKCIDILRYSGYS